VSCELLWIDRGVGREEGGMGSCANEAVAVFFVKKVGKRVVVARKFGLEKLCSCKEKEVKRGRNCFPFQVPASPGERTRFFTILSPSKTRSNDILWFVSFPALAVLAPSMSTPPPRHIPAFVYPY
jgi:hypothetical protein